MAIPGLLLSGCISGSYPPATQRLSLAQIIQLAQKSDGFLPSSDPVTTFPYSALIAPTGVALFIDSPPFAATTTVNSQSWPQLNLLPAVVAGRFAPIVMVEAWTNNYGPVWYNPWYDLLPGDGNGGLAPGTNPYMTLTPSVLSVAPPDDFYSPFWEHTYVLVPPSDVAAVQAHPPTSVAEILNTGYPQLDGPLSIGAIVPPDISFDPPLTHTAGQAPTGFVPWIGAVLNGEYGASGLTQLNSLAVWNGYYWWEGQKVWTLPLGENDFVGTEYNTVTSSPLYVWVDEAPDGSNILLDLPFVLTDGPAPIEANTVPDWSTFWEINYAVRPTGAVPFYPVVADPNNPADMDLFAGMRARFQEMPPSSAVNALSNIARYAGRLALQPACFQDDSTALAALPPASSQTVAWAATCQFLDSSEALTAAVTGENIADAQIAVLAPIQLWTEPQP